MTKIIWLSDPHFYHEGGDVLGVNPRARLAHAIEHVNTHHSDADLAILSGDLVGEDMEQDYALLAQYLSKSKVPIYPMMGNHDERHLLRHHLSLPDTVMPDFVQYALHRPDETLICLDTHKNGSLAGAFCQKRLDWLDRTLEQTADKSAYLFMHHPPHALHLPAQDSIKLEDAEAFLDLISRHSNVKHLFMGHVHRATSGTIKGIPFASLPALSFQAPPPHPAWDWDTFVPAKEAPQYGVLHIQDESVVLQFTQFSKFEDGATI